MNLTGTHVNIPQPHPQTYQRKADSWDAKLIKLIDKYTYKVYAEISP